jgi:[ribosomal protein S5]-alanine N-acetyltransferase
MLVQLIPIPLAQLELLASAGPDGRPIDSLPPHVARRSLALLRQGIPALWSTPYWIVRAENGVVVGACGFKGMPAAASVEIGYAIDPAYRKQGLATAAAHALITLAWQDPTVSSIRATIRPDNTASSRVVEHLGFQRGDTMVDDDGERLVHWHLRRYSCQESLTIRL